jgi:ribonuclease HI
MLLIFKKYKLVVISVYVPPSDKEERKKVQQKVIQKIRECERDKTRVIVMGDFNDIRSKELDHSKEKSNRKQVLPLLRWLENSRLDDIFRKIHPYKKEYTWTNGISHTRIDYIWASSILSQCSLSCEIVEANCITGSDHNIVIAKLGTGISLKTRKLAKEKQLKGKKRILRITEAKEEEWEEYRARLDKEIKKVLEVEDNIELIEERCRSKDINKIWDIISSSIIKSAYLTLPSKKLAARRISPKEICESTNIQKDLKKLGKICHKYSEKVELPMSEEDRQQLNLEIEQINSKYELQIDRITETYWTRERREDIKAWWKCLYSRAQQERKKEDLQEINKCIDTRCEAIQGELKYMLNSLLERPSKKIKVDRVMKVSGGEEILLTEDKEVLNEVRSHFMRQFRRRDVQENNLSSRWSEAYSPIEKIEREIYSNLFDNITENEWSIALSNAKNKSAPGVSSISYPLIKKAGKIAQKIFLVLANRCLAEGDIPIKWKVGQLYPIPKNDDWNYNLSNIRPIILLEAFRKTVVRVVNKRLGQILVEHNVLEGPNYAGLPGDSTSSPIHIMNNLLEDARQKNKEIWILFQDMKKAFDSVSLKMMEKALKRIKMPDLTIKFLLNLYNKRKIRVCTEYGLTKEFEAEDGLDQGEVVSPLMWRIFYDPLLCLIYKKEDLGYKMELKWPANPNTNQTLTSSWQQSVLAYADDTTWIARSEKELQKIIDISNEFYKLNDIEINSKKSELLVLNRKVSNIEEGSTPKIKVGKMKEVVQVKEGKAAIRHLGVWISEKGSKECNETVIIKEVTRMCKVLVWKRASVSQLVYLNNSVLLPSIEYRLQTSFLSKAACKRIQRPIWTLIKNKLGLAKSAPNSMCSHTRILGMRTIWQNQIAHHFTELTIRLNKLDAVGITTRIRIKDAQLEGMYTDNILSSSNELTYTRVKHNVAYKIIFEAKKLGFSFQESSSYEDNLKITGTSIASLLEEKEAIRYRESNNMNIFVLEQLITKEGDVLLTWQQVRIIRGSKGRGRKPNWFKVIENKVIELSITRKIRKEYQILAPNRNALNCEKVKISQDRRKKEWIIFQAERKWEVGKVIKKESKSNLIEHWEEDKSKPYGNMIFKKCKGCAQGKRNDTSCIIRRSNRSWHQVIQKVHRSEEEMSLGIQLSAYLEAEKEYMSDQDYRLETPRINIVEIEEAIIQRVIKDVNLREELSRISGKLKGRKNLDIYTDGSLVVDSSSGRDEKKMGVGWVVVNENIDSSNLSFKCRIVDWPSSTRAELGAIWTAILVAPYEANVRIFSDSKAAIEGIQNFKGLMSIRSNFKTKNRSLISQIVDSCKTKLIKLEMIKVKGHSMNIWNDKADSLAKEGLTSSLILEAQEVTTSLIRVTPLWKNKTIDCALRTFVNITTAAVYETTWANLNSIRSVISARSEDITNDQLNWENTWSALKSLQGKKCTSFKKSNALMFRIKCINKLLPTKDICYQRSPAIYKSKTCIACIASEESLEHLADCQIYQKIWEKIEEIVMETLEAKLYDKWKVNNINQELRRSFLGTNIEAKLSKRRLHIRGLTSISLLMEIKEILGSGAKAKKTVCWFTELFWSNFFERLWKFRCEVMAEWEKRNGIDLKAKKAKLKKKEKCNSNKNRANKENQYPTKEKFSESSENKENRIQKVADTKISNWIEAGSKDNWLSFKNK